MGVRVKDGGGPGEPEKVWSCCCFLPDFSDDMPAVSRWDRVFAAGVEILGQCWKLGARIAQPAAAQRWREEDSGGGWREGGSLKGPRQGRGSASDVPPLGLSLLIWTSLSSHPGIQAPSLGSLGVVMETGRQVRPGKAGGTKERKGGRENSESLPSRDWL